MTSHVHELLPRVSVVCTVRDDLVGLRVMLKSLDAQTRRPDEIVIVDGGSAPESVPALQSLVAAHPQARLILEPGVNIAQGRNIAIGEAKYDLIACIDAGCRARPDWLERLAAPFNGTGARIDVVGGAYAVAGRTRFQRTVGLLALPGQLRPVDPRRFNPSARSLAMRRSAWHRAGGFPEWLHTAEDTLFDLRMRSLSPQVGYAFARDAVVEWEPRTTWRAAFRQFAAYARGEAHIGRGRATHRYTSLRLAAAGSWAISAACCAWNEWISASAASALVILLMGLRTHLSSAWRVARRHDLMTEASRGGDAPAASSQRRVPRWMAASSQCAFGCLVSEWLALAQWFGCRRGMRERRRRPEVFEQELQAYMRSPSGHPPDLDRAPDWNLPGSTPRTLVVSWHWPAANRASANVLGHLFRWASPEHFRVLTRRMGGSEAASADVPPLRTHRIPWPLADDRPVRFRTWWAEIRTLARALISAWRIHMDWDVQCVLSVYPTRYGLLSGWLASRLLGVPHAAYMHDLMRETLMTSSWVKRALWSRMDDRILRTSRWVLVPTLEHARHYESRDIRSCSVLPHTIDSVAGGETGCAPPPDSRSNRETGVALRLVYSGAIYEPHADAVRAILNAIDGEEDVHLRFLSPPQPLLRAQDAGWLQPGPMRVAIRAADACVVALGWETPYPEEIRVCFPSKILDYLQAQRPILAVVPRGCFVDRFMRETGCGVCVNAPEPSAIRMGMERLRDPRTRARMSACAARACGLFDARFWMRTLSTLLTGPGGMGDRAALEIRSAGRAGMEAVDRGTVLPTLRTPLVSRDG